MPRYFEKIYHTTVYGTYNPRLCRST